MKPENPGFLGRETQAGRDFYKNPFAFVERSRHPFLNRLERRSSSSGLGDLRGQTFVSHLTSVKASTEAFTVNPVAILAMSDRRVTPHECHGRGKYSEFRHRRNFIDLELLGARFHALRGRVPVRLNLAGPRHALFSTLKEVPSGQESNQRHRTTAQTAKCRSCLASSLRNHSSPSCAQRRGQSMPVAPGAHHSGKSCPRHRAPSPCFADDTLRADQSRGISRAGSSSWRPGLILAGRSSSRIHCRNGRRCPVKRGKPAPGMKASRVLRRRKRTWGRKK